MKKINFKTLRIQLTFEGEPVEMDVRKIVGNIIRQNTSDIGLDELARKIYFSEGEVEIPDEYVGPILHISSTCFNVPLQQAIKEQLN
jgi:hypothetical protein